jgi:hypothetical protein
MKMIKSLSRKVIAIDNGENLMKIYDNIIAIVVLDLLRNVLSIISLKPQIEFLNADKRIKNELVARKKIKSIATSKIIRYSLEKKFIVERFLKGNVINNPKLSYRIGKFIGQLHNTGTALIDNRPENYIIYKGKIFRVDLEMFRMNASEFDKICDLLSFAESFDDDKIKSAFLRGHKMFCDCSYNIYVGFISKLFLRISAYLE